MVLSAAGAAAMLAFGLLTLRAMKIPLGYIASFPLGFTMHAALTVNSLWKRKRGGKTWKGRVYS